MAPVTPRSKSPTHTHTYIHWEWVNQLRGALYMVSGSVQITAFFRFLPVIILAGLIQLYIFYRQTGRMVMIILRSFSLLTTRSRTHSQQTIENNQLVRGKLRPLHLLHCGLLQPKHFEHKYLVCSSGLSVCTREFMRPHVWVCVGV